MMSAIVRERISTLLQSCRMSLSGKYLHVLIVSMQESISIWETLERCSFSCNFQTATKLAIHVNSAHGQFAQFA
jgi:hypothetical protein